MDPVTITAYDRAYRINNPGVGRVGSKLEHGEPYEKKLLVDAYQHRFRGSAFDVGAHIGNHALYFAAICGLKVYAWEPHEGSLKQLYDNLALNPGLDIDVYEWAAGDRDTVGRLSPGMWLEFDPTREGAKIKLDRGDVPVHRIDDRIRVEDLAVVKIDVEGMEPHVLRGMEDHIRRNRPVIYCETHTSAAREKIREILEPHRYKLGRIINMGSPQHRWDPK